MTLCISTCDTGQTKTVVSWVMRWGGAPTIIGPCVRVNQENLILWMIWNMAVCV